ncbi:MAG: CBS domain-containing protein [Anaerolineaceae bacterium]
MKVILTHEQSDFDAVAALLGAWLLDDASTPVLAARLNRNVRHFLNLYGFELPFIESRDLPAETIDTVTLVDTQSLVTLKGINQKTQVHVIDHHPLRDDLPASWHCEIDKTGACTTQFVERLQDHLSALTMVQATLLLLGIYEDTGAMTYASTTARDIRASAALLEAGASLRIAADFLNPALTDAQKKLADRLLTSSQTHHINGKLILIATGDARDMREEISSVAHKLRDLLDPDGLFILVQTSEGIRLVARSTSDQVNVARIAAQFGGGGHDRAASALIDTHHIKAGQTEPTLEDLVAQLLPILQEEIKPAVTVGKIMSKHPLLLSPETTLYEAQRVMQRYGYEGFPVVDHGKVVGLLTRRAVDRASAHHLNLTTGSLMEAGEYSLTPSDTIDRLQNLMATTGWGQIPVIEPETNKVVGIVTRTDFLKTLPRENNFVPGKINYADLLQKIMPALRLTLIKKVAEQATLEKSPVYIVGGFVRDLILNRPSIDFDIVVEGDAIQLANKLVHRYGGRVISHNRFGTAKWLIKEIKPLLAAALGFSSDQAGQLPDSLDLISARTEFYDHPTALPTVERSSIKLDLHRRDFTINTMALRLDGRHFGELYDYWDGLVDLQKKQVKVLHSLSFVDDPTRLLRAARFEQRFHFAIETRTLQLMNEARPLIKQVSGDRLRHEFNLVFNEENPLPILDRLEELGMFSAIHSGLHWQETQKEALHAALFEPIPVSWKLPAFIDHISLNQALAYLVWLIPAGKESACEIGTRLHLNNVILNALQNGCQIWSDQESLQSLTPSMFFDAVENCPVIAGYALYLLLTPGVFKDKLAQVYTRWQYLVPETGGNKLKEIGLLPGPRYTEIIHRLRSAWIDGEVSTSEQEKALLAKLILP